MKPTSASSRSPPFLASPGSTTTASHPTTTSPLVSTTNVDAVGGGGANVEPSPTDLLLSTPPSLLKLFALVEPVVSVATTFCQLVTWQHSNFFASLLVLLTWWTICLFGRWIVKYGLNCLILVLIGHRYFSSARKSSKSSSSASLSRRKGGGKPPSLTPAGYSQFLQSSHYLFAHLYQFRTSIVNPVSQRLSFAPTRPGANSPAYETARLCVTSYPAYLVLTRCVSLKYLFLLVGSIAILWNAPFFKTLRTLLWRSATVRWTVRLSGAIALDGGRGFRTEWDRTKSRIGIPGYVGSSRLVQRNPSLKYSSSASGQGGGGGRVKGTKQGSDIVEERVVKTSSLVDAKAVELAGAEETKEAATLDREVDGTEAGEEDEEDVEVQFTVFENQRWWVGLDWTHALLPGERASWTDPSSNPSNPPSSFVLPSPQVTYLAAPTRSDPKARLKKTTSWRWLDPEWKVLRESKGSVVLPNVVVASSADSASSPPSSPVLPAGAATGRGGVSTESTASAAPVGTSDKSSASSIFSSLPSPPASLLASAVSGTAVTTAPSSYASPASLISDQHSRLFEHWQVDNEGWQYGDNHFDKMGPKGGLGKYTRRRAWVRMAGLVETTERVAGTTLATAASTTTGSSGTATKARTVSASAGATTVVSSSGGSGRKKSETKASSTERDGGGKSTGTSTSGSLARKRKSMPPSIGSEQSISKDVD